MKIDFNAVIVDLKNEPLKDGDTPLTLGMVATNALLLAPLDPNASGEAHYRRYRLGVKINEGGAQTEVSAEDIALIKGLVAKSYSPLVLGRAFDLLEG